MAGGPAIGRAVQPPSRPLRLRLDGDALVANWRWLRDRAGTACGAAVKADAYGLGAREVVAKLAAAGCRNFFVSTWAEAAALDPWPADLGLAVLHGVSEADLPFALAHSGRPVLNSAEQVARWKRAGGGACDVMVDTGMNRLGLRPEEACSGLLDKLTIDTLLSHLACADEVDEPMNERQRTAFADVAETLPARRRSLANSAGICLGRDYAFDLVRPGLALYGGIPRAEAAGAIRPVVQVEAQCVQRRVARAGETVGYGATWVSEQDQPLLILNLGYADGYLRAFSDRGAAVIGGSRCPVVGRVSMDLIAVAVPLAVSDQVGEGDWVQLCYDLAEASRQTGLSQYELLTGLGARYGRQWT